MFDHKHYVPILKGRKGEYRALREMTDDNRAGFIPMIDLPPLDWDWEKGENKDNLGARLRRLPKTLKKCWGLGRPIFLDFYMIQEVDEMADGRHPLASVFDDLRHLRDRKASSPDAIRAIPVTGLGRPKAYQAAVRQTVESDHRGVCLRLQTKDFEGDENLEESVRTLLSELKVPVSEADLVLDLKDILPSSSGATTLAVKGMVSCLPLLCKWRTFTLAASAFPAILTDLTPYEPRVLPRTEWTVWQAIATGKRRATRLPTFGDYGIRHPHYAEATIDPRTLKSAPNLRYTHVENWIAIRGRDRKKYGMGQFNQLCKIMAERREFCGAQYSWGDFMIDACARDAEGHGDSSMWVAIGTSHHIAYVKHQIANSSAP